MGYWVDLDNRENAFKVSEYLKNDKTNRLIYYGSSFTCYYLGDEGLARIKWDNNTLNAINLPMEITDGINLILEGNK